MITLEKAYEAKNFENSIYKKWEDSGHFKAEIDPNKEGYSISMPPPNATGTLHLGHAIMLAIEDILIRYQRMNGKSALWLPGTDHAAIATQSVVEKKLQESGIKNPRAELGREKLLEEIRKFVEQSKDTIRNQVRKMGSSCDWSREKYTLEDSLTESVHTFFRYMYEDGVIYRGGRIVNWDPKMQTTVADDEIEYVEEKTKFYYFQYGPVVIGTARPETKFEDKIIIVHPDDERYKHLHNKEFKVEWINGPITARVIPDECVDPEMGTGAMTITPAHSLVDFELAQKHDLEAPQIIDYDGNLNETAGEFAGMHITEARDKIVAKMQEKGLVVKIDNEYVHNVAVNYRGKGIIEPQIMKQWFIDVNKKAIDWKGAKLSIKEVMQDVVRSDMIKIHPQRFEKTYFHWIDNLQDWCISRQIWWGHQIPVWHKVTKQQYEEFNKDPEASSLTLNVLGVEGEARFSPEKPEGDDYWIQDPDTLDTWFGVALWTFQTLGWPKSTKELEYFHPTNVLETGYDILFFWVARMILASTYCLRRDGLPEEKCIPFKEVYLHGLIRDIEGKKMSKSKPETCIDPLEMIDKYGTDAVRLSLIIGNTPGNDMRLYEEKISGYRNFINKIWNASRFALMNIEEKDLNEKLTTDKIKTQADKWILTELNKLVEEVSTDIDKYHFSEAANRIYNFTWALYCDWYLEISKGSKQNPAVLLHVLKTLLKLLHPFTPFVTEAIWSHLSEEQMLIKASWPQPNPEHNFEEASENLELIKSVITEIRSIRATYKVEPAKKIKAILYAGNKTSALTEDKEAIKQLARLEELEISEEGEKIEGAANAVCLGVEIYLPLSNLVDPTKERKRLEKEIEKTNQLIAKSNNKLKNANFVEKAPAEVIDREKSLLEKNQQDLEKLESQLQQLQ